LKGKRPEEMEKAERAMYEVGEKRSGVGAIIGKDRKMTTSGGIL